MTSNEKCNLIEAQWATPWIVPPPPENSAFNYLNVTANGATANMYIHEKIPVDRTTTAVLKFSGKCHFHYIPVDT